MKTIDAWFRESIEQYKILTATTIELRESIDSLPIEKIVQRCASIKKLQEDIAERDGKLHEIMYFVGSEVLDNPLIGEYQRALDAAIRETDQIAVKAKLSRAMLIQEIAKIQSSAKVASGNHCGIAEYNNMMLQRL